MAALTDHKRGVLINKPSMPGKLKYLTAEKAQPGSATYTSPNQWIGKPESLASSSICNAIHHFAPKVGSGYETLV
jgi:hypothetical protein